MDDSTSTEVIIKRARDLRNPLPDLLAAIASATNLKTIVNNMFGTNIWSQSIHLNQSHMTTIITEFTAYFG